MVKDFMDETSRGQKYTAHEVGNFFEYEKALTNLESLKIQEARLLLDQGTYSDSEWQKRIDEIVAEKERQEQLIEQYIREMPDRSLKCLGRNIKILMKQSGMKISDLENKLGVSAGYLSRTLNEDSKKRISVDVVWKIALVFNVNIDDLINVDLGAPTKEILTVKDFIKKLREDTDNGVIRWKNYGRKPTEKTELLFESSTWKDDAMVSYSPREYESETAGFALCGDIFGCYLNSKFLMVAPVVDHFRSKRGVEFYTYYLEEGYVNTEEFERICCTMDDGTDVLSEKAEQLLNTIKLHENDFVISASAKSFIEGYLNPEGSDELPFA